jgi:hypothetical protein
MFVNCNLHIPENCCKIVLRTLVCQCNELVKDYLWNVNNIIESKAWNEITIHSTKTDKIISDNE